MKASSNTYQIGSSPSPGKVATRTLLVDDGNHFLSVEIYWLSVFSPSHARPLINTTFVVLKLSTEFFLRPLPKKMVVRLGAEKLIKALFHLFFYLLKNYAPSWNAFHAQLWRGFANHSDFNLKSRQFGDRKDISEFQRPYLTFINK